MLSTLEPFAGKGCRPLLWALNKNISKTNRKGSLFAFPLFSFVQRARLVILRSILCFNFLKECNLSNSYPLTYELKQTFPFFLPTPRHFLYNRNCYLLVINFFLKKNISWGGRRTGKKLSVYLLLAASGLSCAGGIAIVSCRRHSSGGVRAPEPGLSSRGAWALLSRGMWDLTSPTRDQTHISCIGR